MPDAPDAPFPLGRSTPKLLRKAQARLDQRRARETHLPGAIFGETAWEILLHLFIGDTAGAMADAEISKLNRTPPTIVKRWADFLESEGLVEMQTSSLQGCRQKMRLTRKGIKRLNSILEE